MTTSLTPTQATTVEVVGHYQSLANVERRFRVLKDFLGLRPVFHWTENRVKGHIAICVLAAVIEAVIGNKLAVADIRDPDLPDQIINPRRALAELNRIRIHHLQVGEQQIRVITRRNALQTAICTALGINTGTWDNAQSPDPHQRPQPEHVGETPRQRAPAYQAQRKQAVKVRSLSQERDCGRQGNAVMASGRTIGR